VYGSEVVVSEVVDEETSVVLAIVVEDHVDDEEVDGAGPM
jgi:hypothetical protein